MNLEEMSVEQCKVLAYDTLALIEQKQRELQAINQMIAQKSQVKEEPVNYEEMKNMERSKEEVKE